MDEPQRAGELEREVSSRWFPSWWGCSVSPCDEVLHPQGRWSEKIAQWNLSLLSNILTIWSTFAFLASSLLAFSSLNTTA
jgi:hypothetical protein